jgi:carboxymethylenebutenolidase
MYSRRSMIKGAAGLPLAAILADPALAQAVAAGLQEVSLTTKGGLNVKAALALPAKVPAPGILLVHENRGLNDYLKTMAAELAKAGYVALAVDLFKGKLPATPEETRAAMGAVVPAEATDTLTSWLDWLKRQSQVDGKLATIGWCFGGGWSLNASLAYPVDATVVYYGNVAKTADQLKALKGPVLGHFATRDAWITPAMAEGFVKAMAAAGKKLESHNYEADHAFANPSHANYAQGPAKESWERTLAFLKANL